jgi:hypothetical protein
MPLTDRDRRTLKVGGVIAGVLLVGFLLVNLLSGGGAEKGAPFSPRQSPGGSPSTTPTPSSTQTPAPVFQGRDPFSIPGVLAPSSGSSSGSSSSSSSSSGSSSSSSSSSGSSSSSSTTSPTAPGNGSSTSIGGHQVVLLDVFPRNGVEMAQVEIDGVVYTVAEGEAFGPNHAFELRSVSGNCGTFLFGDQAFTLCITPQK